MSGIEDRPGMSDKREIEIAFTLTTHTACERFQSFLAMKRHLDTFSGFPASDLELTHRVLHRMLHVLVHPLHPYRLFNLLLCLQVSFTLPQTRLKLTSMS